MDSFNVAASIKMQKYGMRRLRMVLWLPFNVAASIKMQKFHFFPFFAGSLNCLQCGRIYKDAEMIDRR